MNLALDPRKGKVGKGAEQPAPDGPARVVKPGDWGAVAEGVMKGFTLASFSVPGRAASKPEPSEARLAEMARKLKAAEDAHREALRKAAQEADARVAEAEARGRDQGRREGEKLAGEKYAKSVEDLRKGIRGVLEALSREKASLFMAFEGESVALAATAVKRLFEGIADRHAEAVLPLLRKAVAALGEASALNIRINPADFQVMDEKRSFWIPLESALKDMRIVQDDRIPKGACLVESDSTSIEMRASDLGERMGEALGKVFEAKSRALRDGSGEDAAGIPPAATGSATRTETGGNTGVAAPDLPAEESDDDLGGPLGASAGSRP